MAVTYAKGFSAEALIAAEDTFGTLKGSGEESLRLISETLTEDKMPLEEQIKNANTSSKMPPIFDLTRSGGGLVVEADYDNCVTLLAAGIGATTGDGEESTPYTIAPDDELATSYSVVIDKNVQRYQFTGGYPEEIVIRGNAADSRILIETNWIFQKRTPSDDAIADVSLTSSEILKFSDMVFRIADTANALAAADALIISSFEVRIKNNLKVDYGSGSEYIVEPIRERQRDTTLTFAVPRYDSGDEITAIVAAQTGGTIMQADMTFSGTSPNEFKIELPEMYASRMSDPSVSDYNALTFEAAFNCYDNINNQTYMPSVLDDLELTITNAEDS